MRAALERVLALQASWSAGRSSAMDERGVLVRRVVPAWLEGHRAGIAAAIGIPVDDLLIAGRDGAGAKSRVPWSRFASRRFSPSATEGFYGVLLFDVLGEAVYLSLNQGTADFRGGDVRRKPGHLVRGDAQWARAAVAEWAAGRPDLSPLRLHDHASGLGTGYELGDVASLRYAAGAVPDESTLLADVLSFAAGLGAIYVAQRQEPPPSAAPEVEAAEAAVAQAAGKRRPSRGAGFRADAETIRVVERHAVDMAIAHYAGQGWSVTDVGERESYDLELRRGRRRLHVEVKGTTSEGMVVTLTDGEVRHHERAYPANALVVVRRIVLDRSVSPPRAARGELREIRPWRVDHSDLRAIAHRYMVPPDD